MSRLVGYMGNDPQRVRCVLHAGRALLRAEAAAVESWGVGFYQGGEVLLQRRPKPPEGPVDLYDVAGDAKTDALIGHLRPPGTGVPAKNENTPPFRFRMWLFAHTTEGAALLPGFPDQREAILAAIPDFLRRNIRGQTDSEHLFHLVLGQLHAAGKLDDALIAPRDAGRALAAALEKWDALTSGRARLAAFLTNGRVLVCARRGVPTWSYTVEGLRECPVCREAPQFEPERRSRPRAGDHDHLRGVVVAADPPVAPTAPWQELAEDQLLLVSHELRVERVPIAT